MKIDIHQHIIPRSYLEAVRADPEALGADFDGSSVRLAAGPTYKLTPGLIDLEVRLREMDAARIDMGVISIPPWLFGYAYPPEVAHRMATIANEGLEAAAAAYPGRFIAMGHVPLQDVGWSVAELERRRLPAVHIGSNVNGENLDDPALLPFFQAAARLGTLVFVHPNTTHVLGADRLRRYYLSNLLGYVCDTALAVASVMLGGVLDACPGLRLCFSHGGGAAPFIWGRWEHGQRVRAETVARTSTPVSELKSRCYFDTITHSPAALRYLIAEVGVDRVLMGTDFPFDMAGGDPVGSVEALGLGSEEASAILGGTAAALLKG